MKKLFKGIGDAFKAAAVVAAACMYIYYVGKSLCDFTSWCYKGIMVKLMTKNSNTNDNDD